MAYYITTPKVGSQVLTTTSTTQGPHILGERAIARDPSVTGVKEATFIYVKASVACVQYDTVWIKGASGFTAPISDTLAKTPGQVGFAQVAFAADEYGWVMQDGLPLIRLTSSTEKNVALYVNASAGVLSGATHSTQILGVVALTSVTTTVGAVTCVAKFPTVMRAASLTQI